MDDGAISVFLADDHAMVREALAGVLASTGDIRVVGQCGNGLEVIEAVRRAAPEVVVLDITMPGMNGLDSCRLLARKLKVAILILTMHDNEEIVATALRHGASGYLLKEAAADQLAQAIRAVAKGDLYLGSGIPNAVLQRVRQNAPSAYDKLTTRERQVLHLIAEGKTNREISEHLKLAVKTVDTHRANLMRKLDIHDQTGLVKFALRKGIIPLA